MSTARRIYGTDLAQCGQAETTRVSGMLTRLKSVWRVLRNRMETNRLHDLDDDLLADIGLRRSDVVSALSHSGLLEDPSRILSRAARLRAPQRFQSIPRD